MNVCLLRHTHQHSNYLDTPTKCAEVAIQPLQTQHVCNFAGHLNDNIPFQEPLTSSFQHSILNLQVNEFFSELDIDQSKQKKHLFDFGLRVSRRKSVLPQHLHSVMGGANLALVDGDVARAIELCKEVIRQGIGTFKTLFYLSLKKTGPLQLQFSITLFHCKHSI